MGFNLRKQSAQKAAKVNNQSGAAAAVGKGRAASRSAKTGRFVTTLHRPRSASTSRSTTPAPDVQSEPLTQAQTRTMYLVSSLGSQAAVARLLQVSPSQPSRWIRGQETPSVDTGRQLLDLDHVVGRAGLIWPESVITAWLEGRNSFLGGARPIDVLRTQNSAPVVEALDAELAGAYA